MSFVYLVTNKGATTTRLCLESPERVDDGRYDMASVTHVPFEGPLCPPPGNCVRLRLVTEEQWQEQINLHKMAATIFERIVSFLKNSEPAQESFVVEAGGKYLAKIVDYLDGSETTGEVEVHELRGQLAAVWATKDKLVHCATVSKDGVFRYGRLLKRLGV